MRGRPWLLAAIVIAAPPLAAQCPPGGATLAAALSLMERAEGGDSTILGSASHRPFVDYKSRLVIVPDSQLLRCLAASRRSVLPPLLPSDSARLTAAADLVAAAHAYLESANLALEAVRVARATPLLTLARTAEVQEMIRRQGAQGLTLLDPLIGAARARARAELGETADPDSVDAWAIRMTDHMFVDVRGTDTVNVMLNVPAFAEFLGREIAFATRRADADAAVANTRGTARFRMRAFLLRGGQAPSAVSIENYDDIETLEGPKRPRVAFQMTQQEQARLERGLALATDAARLVVDVRERRSDLREGMRQLADAVQFDLRALDSLVLDSLPADVVNAIEAAVNEAQAILDPTTVLHEQLTRLREFAQRLKQDLAALRAGFAELDSVAEQPDPFALLRLAALVPETVHNAILTTLVLAEQTRPNLAVLDTLPALLEGAAQQAAVRAGAQLVAVLERSETTPALANLAGQLDDYATVATAVQQLISSRTPTAMADVFEEVGLDPRVRTLALDDVVPGTIHLDATAADRGDEVVVRAELLTVGDGGEPEAVQQARQTFRVDRLGLTSEFASYLIFVDRFGGGTPAGTFEPAPSASWVLHYRVRGKNLWSALDPGVGVNTAALDFDDDNFQIGVGAQLTLFDDLLTYGVGYNLSAERDNWYHYLGVGVLQALETVGGLVSGASGRQVLANPAAATAFAHVTSSPARYLMSK